MRRRTVLGIGAAGLVAGLVPFAWVPQPSETRMVSRHLSAARAGAGLAPLTRNPALIRMAADHVRHMAGGGQTTHLGAGGYDPAERAARAGYGGHLLGEALAETAEGPVETVAYWLGHGPTRDVLLDPEARDLGLALQRGPDGRMWWDLVVGVHPERMSAA